MTNYAINEILKKHKITEYLTTKGIEPVGVEINGKLRYRCPLHKGDNTPSFMVYTNDKVENFFCYGCKAGGKIIQLYKAFEGVSMRDAIKSLSNGLELNIDSELDYILREIQEDTLKDQDSNPVEYSLIISRMIFDFTKMVNKNHTELGMADKLLSIVDKAVDDGDMDGLRVIYDTLPDVLRLRTQEFEAEKERAIRLVATQQMADV